jgi:hypothetical protein
VHVIREDPRNATCCGSPSAPFFSPNLARTDEGELNLPTVPIDDIAIHPRDNDLVPTHGRSIWILDDVTRCSRD